MIKDAALFRSRIVGTTTRLTSIFLLALLAVGCSRTVPVQAPQSMHAAPTVAATEQAIGYALAHRGWMVQARQPGQVTAVYIARSHKLWVHINYDYNYVQVKFLGSENLNQSQNGHVIMIHHRANTWLTNLQRDLSAYLSQARGPAAYPPPAPAPPPAPQPGYPPPPPPGT
jgi:hypothetical protein